MTNIDEFIDNFIDLASYRQNQSLVIFLSSGVITNNKILTEIARDLKVLISLGMEIYIIHDFGNLATIALERFNLRVKELFVELGPAHLADTASMILRQQIAGDISAAFEKNGLMSITLSGQNFNLIQAKETRHSFIDHNLGNRIFLGLPHKIDTSLLDELCKTKTICIISPTANYVDSNQSVVLEPCITSSMMANSLAADILLFLTDDKKVAEETNLSLNIKQIKKSTLNSFTTSIKKACLDALDGDTEEIIVAVSTARHVLLNSLMQSKIAT